MSKFKISNATFWVIFKHCARRVEAQEQPQKIVSAILEMIMWILCLRRLFSCWLSGKSDSTGATNSRGWNLRAELSFDCSYLCWSRVSFCPTNWASTGHLIIILLSDAKNHISLELEDSTRAGKTQRIKPTFFAFCTCHLSTLRSAAASHPLL